MENKHIIFLLLTSYDVQIRMDILIKVSRFKSETNENQVSSIYIDKPSMDLIVKLKEVFSNPKIKKVLLLCEKSSIKLAQKQLSLLNDTNFHLIDLIEFDLSNIDEIMLKLTKGAVA